MIPRSEIAYWRYAHNWNTDDQVEQDLLLSEAMCLIGNDEFLSEELVIRGGTAYHKLFLPEPLRYSEDLDYVRTSSGPIGDVMKRLTRIGEDCGFEVRTRPGMYPKVLWRYTSESGTRMKIKIEVNTFERFPAFSLRRVPFSVVTPLRNLSSNVLTFRVEELVATKMRALYQRSKGRDLFDLWLALTRLPLDYEAVVEAFPIYRPEGLTKRKMAENLQAKLCDKQFRTDMDALIRHAAVSYDVDIAADLVLDKLVGLI